ncbi:sodium/hydrogen exchanger [Gemmatirosa kalamazoonensis]|uniref:Sodium/hydrogen exchanger n=1 Tax=Gemmatirosa kalamazoonensis TaxID=861299 RepID=W0RGG9_9BACT|nr:sodium:proton antiporter [Gemmatirosa kalamazoonensis]AHG88498.1 sodium/hydrogen exchanger [Gemmatirosa kalamazoonensis]
MSGEPHLGVTLVLLFVVATIVALVARRVRVPYTVALVIAGLGLGATHVIEAPPLTKELLFTLFLPGLLFEAAFHLEWREFWHDRVTLVALAVPGVVAAMAVIGVALVPTMRLLGVDGGTTAALGTHAVLLFAALISATDPVAVVALFRALAAPRRLTVVVEGESLLNDGTAIIFFTLALGALAGPVSLGGLALDFLYVVGVGVVVGGATGVAGAELIRRVDEPMLEIMVTTIVAYGSFIAADELRASGVIATVTAGMLGGSRVGRRGLSAPARVAVVTFWEYVAFALNSVVFLLIGLVVRVPALLASWRAIVAAYLVVTASRGIVTWALARLLPKRLELPSGWTPLLAWGGLRGALSMVLALAIPELVGARDTLVTITFGVVILSILLQGATIGPALRWLGVARESSHDSPYAVTRGALIAAHAALQELERTTGGGHDGDATAAEHHALAEEAIGHVRRAEGELAAALDRAPTRGVPHTRDDG